MGVEQTKQGRRLFFGKREDLEPEALARLRAAEARAEAAETRAGDLQAELMFYGDAIRSLKADLEAVPERVASQVQHPALADIEARKAENAALRTDLESVRSELRYEVDRLSAWQQDVQSIVSSLQGEIEQARRAIDQMPERIREALTPAAEAMSGVDARLVELAQVYVPAIAVRVPEPAPAEEPVSAGGFTAPQPAREWDAEPETESVPSMPWGE